MVKLLGTFITVTITIKHFPTIKQQYESSHLFEALVLLICIFAWYKVLTFLIEVVTSLWDLSTIMADFLDDNEYLMRLMLILLEKLCCLISVMIITCFLYTGMDIVFKPWNELECRLFATGFLPGGFLAFVVVCCG